MAPDIVRNPALFKFDKAILNHSQSIVINFLLPAVDPVVAAEFAQVQPMAFEDVEEELQKSGIRVGATMNDMEAKLMLVEMRLRLSGKLNGDDTKKRPAKFSSKLEEAIWTKPAFKEFYSKIKAKGDAATANVVRFLSFFQMSPSFCIAKTSISFDLTAF